MNWQRTWNRMTSYGVNDAVADRKGLCHTMCPNRFALMLPLIALGLAGCGGGFRDSASPSQNVLVHLSLIPSLITVAAGSNITFNTLFTPGPPEGGSLTWSVNPATAGTITSAGVYTASGTAGNCTVVATWTPSNPLAGTTRISGSATVRVLPVAQQGAELNTNFTQASGAIQANGVIQNAAIVGQPVPSVISTDPNGNIQLHSGFTIPVACGGSGASCR